MVVEEYSFEQGFRIVDKTEYHSRTQWDHKCMINILRGSHVGYKIYNCTMALFDTLSDSQRQKYLIEQKFDKHAYINKENTV